MSLLSWLNPIGNPVNQALVGATSGGSGGGGGGSGDPITDTYGPGATQALIDKYPVLLQSYNDAGGASGLNGRSFGVWVNDYFNQHPENTGNQQAIRELANYAKTGSMDLNADPSTNADGSVPVEQGIYDKVLPSLVSDIDQDTQRRQLAATLGTQLQGDYNTGRSTLETALGPSFDSDAYYKANPDVAAAYAQSDKSMTPQQFAQNDYETRGKAAGAQGSYNSLLQRDNANADATQAAVTGAAQTSATAQLGAMTHYVDSMLTNLDGAQAAKATALKQMIADLGANINTYTDEQKTSLANQIKTAGFDLETSIKSQQDNLKTEIGQLTDANDAQSVARKQALQSEYDKLTAAQAPVSNARLAGATDAATAVNIALQQQQDKLTATQAQQGYIGGSTADATNAARASIAARQQAAGIYGQARLDNATDQRAVDANNATQGYGIATDTAANAAGIAQQNAIGGRTLSDALATGTQNLGDYAATQGRSINDTSGLALKNVADTGATTTNANAVDAANQAQAINNTGATGTLGINTTLAQQTQQAANNAAGQKSGYYDANYPRALSAALTLPSLTTNLTSSLTGLDNYGNSGLTRSLNTLNWWSGGGQAQTPGAVATTPDTTGSGLASLGAGLLGSAINVGNSNKWWTTPTAPSVSNTAQAQTGTNDLIGAGL